MSEWISVEDGLPENDVEVLITDGDMVLGGCWLDWGCHNGLYWNTHNEEKFYALSEVTHWMPLPEPPTEEPK